MGRTWAKFKNFFSSKPKGPMKKEMKKANNDQSGIDWTPFRIFFILVAAFVVTNIIVGVFFFTTIIWELQLWGISWLRAGRLLQTWELLLWSLILAFSGGRLFPVLSIHQEDGKEKYWYVRSSTEYKSGVKFRTFKRLIGKDVEISERVIYKTNFGFEYNNWRNVIKTTRDGMIKYETPEEKETLHADIADKKFDMLWDEIDNLINDMANRKTPIDPEQEMRRLQRNMNQGRPQRGERDYERE